MKYADEIGGTTLEGTPGGNIINNWAELNDHFSGWRGDPEPNGFSLWGGVSSKYAEGATGKVTVVQSAEKAAQGGGDVWKNAEKRILESNTEDGIVTDIIYIVGG